MVSNEPLDINVTTLAVSRVLPQLNSQMADLCWRRFWCCLLIGVVVDMAWIEKVRKRKDVMKLWVEVVFCP